MVDVPERLHGARTPIRESAMSTRLPRRSVLSLLALLGTMCSASSRIIRGGRAFERARTPPPVQVDHFAPWGFLTDDEGVAVEAIVDRLIPPDGEGPGGRDAGCAVFIDRQLAGDYGRSITWYLAGPSAVGTPQQGPQHTDTIADCYRAGLAALDQYCRGRYDGRRFAALTPEMQDSVLAAMEHGKAELGVIDSRAFFQRLLGNTRQGYLADPAYGGNRNMAGWRLIGFPGARYDYRPFLGRPGEDLALDPVSLFGTESRSLGKEL